MSKAHSRSGRDMSGKNSSGVRISKASLLPSGTISPKSYLWLLIPAAAAVLLSLFLREDAGNFLVWWITLLVFGLAAFPLTAYLFRFFEGRGYGFSKAAGVLIVAFVVWTLAYVKVLPFTQPFILLILLSLGAVSWGVPVTRNAAFDAVKAKNGLRDVAIQESLFIVALFAWCVIKGNYSAIIGEEKFMDFAFLNVLVRTDSLPSPDPWMAGQTINYYYFGQYIYALLTKFSGVRNAVAYNLAMCSCFAFTFSMSYSLGSMFMDGAIKKGLPAPKLFRTGAGILTALCVSLFGNSHAFYYWEKSPGNGLLSTFSEFGINVGRTASFFYPDSTRFIGYNPESEIYDAAMAVIKAGDRTIHEFPVYSFLLGDLHAHVVSMLGVLLIIAILFALFWAAREPFWDDRYGSKGTITSPGYSFLQHLRGELFLVLQPEIIATGFLLAIATMCNYWDFLIYFIFSCMVLLIYATKRSAKLATLPGLIFFAAQTAMILLCYLKFSSQPAAHFGMQFLVLALSLCGTALLPCALTRTGLGMSFLFVTATLGSLPFNMNFDMIANALARVENTTSGYQFFILWGTHLTFAIVLILFTLLRGFLHRSEEKSSRGPVSGFLSRLLPTDLFMSGTAVVGFILLLAPEIFYVMDIYGGSYKRANTMFKFTFEAFILLSLVVGYTLFRLYAARTQSTIKNILILSTAIFLTGSIFVIGTYPAVSIEQRSGAISLDESFTLDGTASLADRDSPQLTGYMGDMRSYLEAIDWLNLYVDGTPVICEAFGPSYTDFNIVSAYTGLPTVIGWQTHEWLWRFQGVVDENGDLVSDPAKADVWLDVMTPRNNDIALIYTSSDAAQVLETLKRYNVEYLIVGDLERVQYPTINDSLLKSLGSVVFESGSLYIVEIGAESSVPYHEA